LPRLRPVEQLVLDYGATGLSLTDHPLRHLRSRLRSQQVVTAAELAELPHGKDVAIAGLVIGRQRPVTATGVTFVTLEDELGTMNLIVSRKVWDAHHVAAQQARMLLVRGRLERQGLVVHVVVSAMERLDLPNQAALAARSRDYH
jgi:error-prone DNA polymerase